MHVKDVLTYNARFPAAAAVLPPLPQRAEWALDAGPLQNASAQRGTAGIA